MNAAKEARKKLGEMVQLVNWSGWYVYPYLIDGAPGENALIQSFQRYHDRQVVKATFQLVAKAWGTQEEMDEKAENQPRHEMDVVITSLTNMQPACFAQRARYVFAAEIVSGDHEGKKMVGYTLTEVQVGGCYLFGESSPRVYWRLDKARSAWLHKLGCPITPDEIRDGDFSKVPRTDKDFQKIMFTAEVIHDEERAGGMIPLTADWMRAMNPHHP